MSEKTLRLSKVSRELNVGTSTITDFLASKGYSVDNSPNSKINMEQFALLQKEYETSRAAKEEASGLSIGVKNKKEQNEVVEEQPDRSDNEEEILIKNVGAAEKTPPKENPEVIRAKGSVQGMRVVGKIDLNRPKYTPPKQAPQEEPAKKEVEKPKTTTPPAPTETKEDEKVEVPRAKAEEKAVEKPAEVAKELPKEEKAIPPKAPEEKAEAPTEKVEAKKIVEEKAITEPEKELPKEEKVKPEAKSEEVPADDKEGTIHAKADKLQGLRVLGKIELPSTPSKKKPERVASSDDAHKKKEAAKEAGANSAAGRRKRKRIRTNPSVESRRGKGAGNLNKTAAAAPGARKVKEELTDKQIQEQIKATLAKLSGGKKNSNAAKYRKEKRSAIASAKQQQDDTVDSKILRVTEFVSANDLASLMDVNVNEVISACLSLGLFVSINQRLDAETITIIADEFGFNVEFVKPEDETEEELIEEDNIDNLEERAPVVTIMGHVDHGKTSLLDYIRNTKVTEGEAGGITQHIGAYDVTTESGKRIVFLDTPGHEAFTAMRARGASLTDVAIIVIAADDGVMPQTKEAINHSANAGVPMVFAINKIDRPNANPDKIKEELANLNYLVEDWGGKYQCQLISAKKGDGIEDLLEKVLLESEMLELKADAKKRAHGTVIEAALDKGRGYVTTVLNEGGTLRVGDIILAGSHMGRVKAMSDHRAKKLNAVGPAVPVLLLGLSGAPQAGDKYNVMASEREAREIANNRAQIQREQTMRTKKHITLDEIGRRLAIGSFKELNVIVKGDVDGSVEALADSLLKLSTDEIKVNIIHKGVGQISESDVLLATASDAVILGFQVRPSGSARKLADSEEIEIRMYSIIYDAINEIKDAMEGMLEPSKEEYVIGTVEIRDVFKISKVGTVAGSYVKEGVVKRKSSVRVIRDGIVMADTFIEDLKRHKDDVAEVKFGYECGIRLKGFNDVLEGDEIEVYEEREVKRKL